MVDDRLLFAVVLALGVVGSGLAKYWLTGAGYPDAGTAAWVGGYGVTVLVLWYRWIRPLDLLGPDRGGTEP